MEKQKDRAFALRTYPYGEADRVAVFFTENHGLLRGVAKGSRKLKSRVAGALEPLTLVNLMFVEKAGRELAVVTGCEAVRSLIDIIQDIEVAGVVSAVAELTIEFHADRDPNPRHFRLLEVAQESLTKKLAPELVLRYVELFTLKLHGVLPPLEAVANPEARELMRKLSRVNLVLDGPPEHEVTDLRELGRFLGRQVQKTLGKKLKSYRFIEELESMGRETGNAGR